MRARSAIFLAGDRPWVNLLLLVTTLGSTFTCFLVLFGGGVTGGRAEELKGALQFSLALVSILGAHEMGHYLLARYHRVDTSLPYFIPVPIGMGTLGAVIRLRGPIPHRNALVDIGAAGPLAGLVVALPVLVVGLMRSTVGEAPALPSAFPRDGSLWSLGLQLYEFLHARWAHLPAAPEAPELLTRVTTVFGDNLLMLLLQRLVFGPLPAGHEVFVHPLVIAGWFGLLVTMLNLVPIGQLDGGHLTAAVLGPRARALGKVMALGMLGLCLFFSAGWLLWLLITTRLIGFGHPPVVDAEAPLSRGRFLLCGLCAVALVLCVMPVPLSQVMAR